MGEEVTVSKMIGCSWLHPFIVARIVFPEGMPENPLRHPRFDLNP